MSDKNLTDKEELFAYLFIRYGNATKAYREAYDTTTDRADTVWGSARDVKQRPHVARRIEELRAKYIEDHYSVESRLNTLQDVIEKCAGAKKIRISTKDGPVDVRSFKPMYVIQAVNEMNKMLGGHAPTQIEERSTQDVRVTEVEVPSNGRDGQNLKDGKDNGDTS